MGAQPADFERAVATSAPQLTPEENAAVQRELSQLRRLGLRDGLLATMRQIAAAVPERLYRDSAEVLLRMHEIAGSGNHQSCLSSLPTVRACFELGLIPPAGTRAPADLIVGRGHIAPSFYAEQYVRGDLPFLPLATLHQGGMTGVVNQDWGFRNTMRYSLGVGVAQAVSLAWELKRQGDERKVVCLAGDGELHEGVTFECIRFTDEAELGNLIMVVDANDMGIEPLLKPLNRDYLRSYFRSVVEVDGRDSAAVQAALAELLATPGPTALVCRTRKDGHSYRRPSTGSAPARPTFASTGGRRLAELQRRSGRELAVFTADLAARFGLSGQVPYQNVGLAESLGIGLTLSLPPEHLKVVATDAMYYMDSLSMLTEASTSVRNLLVLAGRNWGAWGGSANAFNLLALIANTRVYEPITPAEFQACTDRLEGEPSTVHVLSMVDARFDEPPADCSADIDDGVWLNAPEAGDCDLAVVSFGYASTLLARANASLGIPHLHCAALNPVLRQEVVERLARFRHVLSVEYNGVHGGFGEWLRNRYLLPVAVHGVEADIDNCVHDIQLQRHGMSPAQLRDLLMSFRNSQEAHYAIART
ncbi:transketolase [Kitasatospora sp. MAP12-15]|uniref:1-deoxy-D-xylulose-5-phosphate synthase N-terminal domain-containing protein n=1 Tax=unclassified Kitasatospora TaxID=2633591 RepID=UPI0024756CDC|nr:1-deoxy-D-xylulose-5-phosphate synthase N-terminal domain-containing protein [Kitasatospora sp. MAP12-44]MDH6115457.1 transketolase [Kitasatospora sp. MAP12-44]